MLRLSRVSVEPPVYGAGRLAAYRAADLFILPTLNENFAMTVAESLAAGTPVISTKGAPWPGLETEGCGWWIEHGGAAMTAALTAALVLPDAELAAMGARGRAWMTRDFGWEAIGRRMLAAYEWAAGAGERPKEART